MNSVNSITRREFALGAAAFAAAGCVLSAPEASDGKGAEGIKVRFLGSGAAGILSGSREVRTRGVRRAC